MTNLQICYQYDDKGHYNGTAYFQILGGQKLLPPNTTETKPNLKEGYFYTINEDKKAWIETKLPSTLQDFAEQKIIIEHTDNCMYANTLKEILHGLEQNNNTDYLIKRDENLNYYVEKKAEPTESEKELEELEQQSTDLNNEINALKNELLTATLADDTDLIESIKAQYQTLVGGE